MVYYIHFYTNLVKNFNVVCIWKNEIHICIFIFCQFYAICNRNVIIASYVKVMVLLYSISIYVYLSCFKGIWKNIDKRTSKHFVLDVYGLCSTRNILVTSSVSNFKWCKNSLIHKNLRSRLPSYSLWFMFSSYKCCYEICKTKWYSESASNNIRYQFFYIADSLKFYRDFYLNICSIR